MVLLPRDSPEIARAFPLVRLIMPSPLLSPPHFWVSEDTWGNQLSLCQGQVPSTCAPPVPKEVPVLFSSPTTPLDWASVLGVVKPSCGYQASGCALSG